MESLPQVHTNVDGDQRTENEGTKKYLKKIERKIKHETEYNHKGT